MSFLSERLMGSVGGLCVSCGLGLLACRGGAPPIQATTPPPQFDARIAALSGRWAKSLLSRKSVKVTMSCLRLALMCRWRSLSKPYDECLLDALNCAASSQYLARNGVGMIGSAPQVPHRLGAAHDGILGDGHRTRCSGLPSPDRMDPSFSIIPSLGHGGVSMRPAVGLSHRGPPAIQL